MTISPATGRLLALAIFLFYTGVIYWAFTTDKRKYKRDKRGRFTK